jgi:hypothetical protein
MPAKKLDLYRLHQAEYVAPREPVLLDLKPANYLAIAGRGEPGGAAFQARIGALYGVAYTLKFAKKAAGRDYGVCKLEGLWWGSGGKLDFSAEPKETWNWKLLIRTPDFITARDVAQAAAALRKKGKGPEVDDVQLETLREGRAVQMLHVGPYDREAETIAAMRAHAQAHGRRFAGRHHEIYLSDPRRVAPAKLRTILRMPVR